MSSTEYYEECGRSMSVSDFLNLNIPECEIILRKLHGKKEHYTN